jgi:hypothetical protein
LSEHRHLRERSSACLKLDRHEIRAYASAAAKMDSVPAQKRNGQSDRILLAALPTRGEEEESRETCLAAI